jgi:hypothetical protein
MPQPGTVARCRRYRRVMGGDSCQGLQQAYGISAAQFNTWNPGVGSNCASLWAGYFVCGGRLADETSAVGRCRERGRSR